MRKALAVLGFALAMYAQQSGKRDAGGVPAPTVRLERGRTVYVLSSCHFCHGIDLTGAAMGSADLLHVSSVGRDEGGNYIGVIVRNGLPNLQTAMPQYSDYTAEQISDLAAYVHYLRRLGRYRELTSLPSPDSGDPKAGEEYFKRNCASCHAAPFASYETRELAQKILRPGPESWFSDEALAAGAAAHMKLLERYTDAEFRNVLTYLAQHH